MKDWKKWNRVCILLNENGQIQIAKEVGDPLQLLGGKTELVYKEDGYRIFRKRGAGQSKNILGSLIVGKGRKGDMLICVEGIDNYGEVRLAGMTPSMAKKWLVRMKKLKQEALALRK